MLFKKIKKIESLNNSEDLYNNIISFVKEKKEINISELQRHFQFKYLEAENYINKMLKDNIIYPSIDKIGNYYLKQNYIDVINKEKIKEEKLQEIADIAFESEYLKNEKRDKILEGGKTLEQTIKDSYKNALLAEQNSTNPKFHRTSHQKELSFKFKEEHKIKIEEMENKIYDLDELIVEIKKSSNLKINTPKKPQCIFVKKK